MASHTDCVISVCQIGVVLVVVFVGVFVFKLANMAFGKHSLDQAFSRSEHDHFYTKICAKELLLTQVRILCTEQYDYFF